MNVKPDSSPKLVGGTQVSSTSSKKDVRAQIKTLLTGFIEDLNSCSSDAASSSDKVSGDPLGSAQKAVIVESLENSISELLQLVNQDGSNLSDKSQDKVTEEATLADTARKQGEKKSDKQGDIKNDTNNNNSSGDSASPETGGLSVDNMPDNGVSDAAAASGGLGEGADDVMDALETADDLYNSGLTLLNDFIDAIHDVDLGRLNPFSEDHIDSLTDSLVHLIDSKAKFALKEFSSVFFVGITIYMTVHELRSMSRYEGKVKSLVGKCRRDFEEKRNERRRNLLFAFDKMVDQMVEGMVETKEFTPEQIKTVLDLRSLFTQCEEDPAVFDQIKAAVESLDTNFPGVDFLKSFVEKSQFILQDLPNPDIDGIDTALESYVREDQEVLDLYEKFKADPSSKNKKMLVRKLPEELRKQLHSHSMNDIMTKMNEWKFFSFQDLQDFKTSRDIDGLKQKLSAERVAKINISFSNVFGKDDEVAEQIQGSASEVAVEQRPEYVLSQTCFKDADNRQKIQYLEKIQSRASSKAYKGLRIAYSLSKVCFKTAMFMVATHAITSSLPAVVVLGVAFKYTSVAIMGVSSALKFANNRTFKKDENYMSWRERYFLNQVESMKKNADEAFELKGLFEEKHRQYTSQNYDRRGMLEKRSRVPVCIDFLGRNKESTSSELSSTRSLFLAARQEKAQRSALISLVKYRPRRRMKKILVNNFFEQKIKSGDKLHGIYGKEKSDDFVHARDDLIDLHDKMLAFKSGKSFVDRIKDWVRPGLEASETAAYLGNASEAPTHVYQKTFDGLQRQNEVLRVNKQRLQEMKSLRDQLGQSKSLNVRELKKFLSSEDTAKLMQIEEYRSTLAKGLQDIDAKNALIGVVHSFLGVDQKFFLNSSLDEIMSAVNDKLNIKMAKQIEGIEKECIALNGEINEGLVTLKGSLFFQSYQRGVAAKKDQQGLSDFDDEFTQLESYFKTDQERRVTLFKSKTAMKKGVALLKDLESRNICIPQQDRVAFLMNPFLYFKYHLEHPEINEFENTSLVQLFMELPTDEELESVQNFSDFCDTVDGL